MPVPPARPFLRGLPARFSPRRSWLGLEGLQRERSGWRLVGSGELVVSRGLCRFGRFDFSQVPAARRAAALRLKLASWAPFREPAAATVWQAGVATVWCWDAARAEQAAGGQRLRLRDFSRILPETLLQPPPAGEGGLRLVRTREGFEGQCWRAGALEASRWWPAEPDDAAWLAFARTCALPPGAQQARPQACLPEALPRPWARASAVAPGAGGAPAWEPLAHAVVALGVGLPAAVLGVREVQLQRASAEATAQLQGLKASAAPLLRARESALASLGELQALAALQPYPEPLALMAAVARERPASGGSVLEWEMVEGRLRLLVASPAGAPPGAEWVEALERTGHFDDVRIVHQADPRSLGFVLQVRALAPAAGGAGGDPSSPGKGPAR